MNDFLRRLTILSLIPRRRSGKVSAPLLLDTVREMGFQGNARAVQRDLVFLAKLFPDLRNDAARSGGLGWFWAQDAAVMDLPALDPALALTFVMARDLLAPLLPPLPLQRLSP